MKTPDQVLQSTVWSAVASRSMARSERLVGAAGTDHDVIRLERVEFPVTLSDHRTDTVVGYLYTPNDASEAGQKSSRTVQVLLHGGTYNHRYWDAGTIQGIDYSYARFMVARGYAVLALDRLGAGESSKPDGDGLTQDKIAASLVHVLTALRQPQNPTLHAFNRIVLVGHSLGTWSALYTLGTYGQVADLLVATGWVNAPGVVPLNPAWVDATLAEPYLVFPARSGPPSFITCPRPIPASSPSTMPRSRRPCRAAFGGMRSRS